MKYEVGDKVKLRKNLKEGEFYGDLYNPRGIKEFASGVMTIKKVVGDDFYDSYYEVEENTFHFNDKMVEGFEKEIEEFKKGEFEIMPETQKEYDSLMELLETYGMRWRSGDKPTKNNYFCEHAERTISIEKGTRPEITWGYANGLFKEEKGKKVITYKQFIEGEFMKQFNKHDLQVGDVITFRNGKTGTWTNDGVLLLNGKYVYRHYLNFDLENTGAVGRDYDIVKVERIKGAETLYERKEEVLDKVEKNYLKGIIRPFRDEVQSIAKITGFRGAYIVIRLKGEPNMTLPYLKGDTMYKGMELNKSYTLEELGL